MQQHNELDGFQRWRFVGKDGSLGYRTGRVYKLFVRHYFNEVQDGVYRISRVIIVRTGLQALLYGRGACPYASRKLFEENWEQV